MRTTLGVTLLVFLMAGCTTGSVPDPEIELTCPRWTRGLGTFEFYGNGFFHERDTAIQKQDNISQAMSLQGAPMDWIELDFFQKRDVNGNVVMQNGTPVQQFMLVGRGILQVQFFRNDTGELLLVHDSRTGPRGPNNPPTESATFNEGYWTNFTLHVELAPYDQTPVPTQVNAVWTLIGVRNGDPETSAYAYRHTTAYFWYRECNAGETQSI